MSMEIIWIWGLSLLVVLKDGNANCVFGKYDLEVLDGTSWNTTVHDKEVVTHYQLSLCSPSMHCGGNSTLCMTQGDMSVTWVTPANTPRVTDNEDKTGFWLHYSGTTCASSPQKTYVVAINFFCGVGLGSPELVHSSECDLYFKWTTSAACSVKTNRREVPCYVYDKDEKKRDLSALILSFGGYRVKSTVPAIEFDINVCSSIAYDKKDPKCSDGTGACRKTGSEVIDFGKPEAPLSIDDDGNLVLVYSAAKSAIIPAGCTATPKTTMTFVCPHDQKRKHNSGLVQFADPMLTEMSNCQYEVEWVTEHACPEEMLLSDTCQLRKEEHGVELDLATLKRPQDDPYVINAIIDGKPTSFELNLCDGISRSCHGESGSSTSVCMNRGVILGSNSKVKLKFVDGDINMIFDGGDKCPTGNSQLRAIVNFRCNRSIDRGVPVFNAVLDNCTYIFDWVTDVSCLGNRAGLQCQVNDGTRHIDLSLLSKPEGSGVWDVETTGVPSYRSTQIVLNICNSLNADGQFSDCPHESAACMRGSDGTMLSLGRYESDPTFVDSKTIQMSYVNGSLCAASNSKTLSTLITFMCKTGETGSGPVLTRVSEDKCTFEIEWSTAAACVQDMSVGKDCKVFDDELDISVDLSRLRKPQAYKTSNDEYDFYLNVCGESVSAECKILGPHGACQVKKSNRSQIWNLGMANDELRYFNGLVNLTYTGGNPYNTPLHPLRQTSISFLCNPEAGDGHPEFVEENTEQKYNFKWYTSLVCPQRPIECSVTNPDTKETFDLSRLTKTNSDSDWEVIFDVNGQKKKFYMNVCRSLTKAVAGCSSESAACMTDIDQKTQVVNMGNAMSRPYIETGIVTLKYETGDKCDDYNTYTTYIHFMCPKKASSVETIKFLKTIRRCDYLFLWITEAACPLQARTSSNENCRILDKRANYEYNLSALKGAYNVTSNSGVFDIGLCGTSVTCSGINAAVCMKTPNQNDQTVALTTLKSISLPEQNRIVVTYQNALDIKTGAPKSTVEIEFLCKPKENKKEIKFAKQDGTRYLFRMETELACIPETFECLASDKQGNVYDFSALARMDANWEVEDTRAHFNDYRYYINVCRPLVRMNALECAGNNVGACQISKSSNKSFSLGAIRSEPKVFGKGELKLLYTGGTPCHNNQFERSLFVDFHCSNVEEAPKFLDESPECGYAFSWNTPAACPIRLAEGSNCKVQDPQFEHEFDLTSLRSKSPVEFQQDGMTYKVGVCQEVNCGKEKNSGVCQIKDNKFVSSGKFNDKLTYKNGELSLSYQEPSTSCVGQKQSTKITFVCSSVTDEKPTLLRESYPCSLLFIWKTSLACSPSTVVDCKTHNSNGDVYDLSSLTLPSNNYEYMTSDKTYKFFINVCHSVHRKPGILCNYSSGVCSVNMKEKDQTKKFVNLGNVGSGPYFENGVLKLKYVSGDSCENNQKRQSIISFHCDRSKIESEPILLQRDSCTWYFIWDTAAACPLVKDDVLVPNSQCKATNPITGFQFDLNLLNRNTGYNLNDQQGHKYTLNVCGNVSGSVCGDGTGSCQWEETSNRHWSMGAANRNLHYHNGVLFLNYTGGSPCHDGKFTRTTVIQFVCSQSSDIGEPVFVDESEDCTYHVTWHTTLACERQVYCKADSGSSFIDLTSLAKKDAYYTATAPLDDYNAYFISICRPLNPVPHCPPEAAACMVTLDTHESLSLGQVENPPYFDANKHVTITYSNGSPCPHDLSKRIQSRIIFTCQDTDEETLPELVEVDNCEYVFEWFTNAACDKTSTALTFTGPDSCTFINASAKIIFDLSSVETYSKDHEQEMKNKNTVFSMCNAETTSCGADSVICENSTSLGKASSVRATYEDEILKLSFKDGSHCQGDQKWSSDIWFICDENVGAPILVQTLPCHKYFHWKTNAACTVEECTVFDANNNFLDFRLLSSTTNEWTIAGPNNMNFMLNVCHGLPITMDPLSIHHCSIADAVCVIDSDEMYGIGQMDSQRFTVENGKDVVLTYDGSVSIPICNSGEKPRTSIYFECDNSWGQPVFKSMDKCHFKFEWKTITACPKKRNQQEKLLLLSNGIIHDQLLNMNINLSALNDRAFVLEETRGEEHFTYEIVLDPKMPNRSSCKASGVCQTESHSFHRLIGNLSNARIDRTDDALEMILPSSSPCRHNPKKNVSTMIMFECSMSPDVGKPQFVYESSDCVFVFNWPTSLSCLSNYFHANGAKTKHGTSQESMSTGTIFAIVGLVLTVVVSIIFVANKQSFRDAANYRLRQLWRKTKWGPSYHYSVLPQNPEENNERTSLLMNQDELNHVQASQDDSDDEVLQF